MTQQPGLNGPITNPFVPLPELPPCQNISAAGRTHVIPQGMELQNTDWLPISSGGRHAKETLVLHHAVEVTEPSPIYDGTCRDTSDLEAEEAITRAERAMAEGDREAALEAVREARDLLLANVFLDAIIDTRAGDQL